MSAWLNNPRSNNGHRRQRQLPRRLLTADGRFDIADSSFLGGAPLLVRVQICLQVRCDGSDGTDHRKPTVVQLDVLCRRLVVLERRALTDLQGVAEVARL